MNALRALDQIPATTLVAHSRWYRSAPLGVTAQPDFINGVAALDTTLAPLPLLDHLLEIERRAGRQRLLPGGPRTLDLDLLLYGRMQLAHERLALPHPRMHIRAFVLLPLLELDRGVQIPGASSALAYLAGTHGQVVEVLDEPC